MSYSDFDSSDYNEIEDIHFNDAPSIHEKHAPNKHYHKEKLYILAKELISELSAEKGLTHSYSRLYLSQNSWNLAEVENFMQSTNYEFPFYEDIQNDSQKCIICTKGNSGNLLKLTCNHIICKPCLSRKLKASLSSIEECFNLKCPKCFFLIDEELFFEEYLDQDSLDIYHTLLTTSLISTKKITFCKSEFCEYATVLNNSETEYLCECGLTNCSSCGRSFHLPLNCDENEFWISHLPEPPVFTRTCKNRICLITKETNQFFTCLCNIRFCIWCFQSPDNHPGTCRDELGIEYQINFIIYKLEEFEKSQNKEKSIMYIQCYSSHLFHLFLRYETQLLAVDLAHDYFFENFNLVWNKENVEEAYKILTELPRKIAYICAGISFYEYNLELFTKHLKDIFNLLDSFVTEFQLKHDNRFYEAIKYSGILSKFYESLLKDFHFSSRRYLS